MSRQSQVRDLGLITSRAQPGLRQQHDVDVVVKNERGDVGSSPGRADGSCIKETDKERVFSREGKKGNAKQLSASRTHRSTKRGSGAVTVIW